MHQLFYSTLSPLVDGTTLSLLGEQRARYGSLRAWGTVGFTVMSASIGFVFERAGLPALFIVYPLTLLALLAAAMTLPSRPVYVRGALLSGLWPMLRQRQWQVFIGSLFVFALGISGLFSFMSITIKALGGSDSLVGLAWTVAALAEIPVMLLGQQLLHHLGARRMLIIGFLATAVRMVIISLAPTAQWLLLPQALNGFSYAFYWLGAMTYGSELAGPERQSTQVGLTVATFSLASMVGSAVSGVLFDTLGPAGLFRVLAGFALAAFLLFTWGTGGERSPRRSS
jgi:predicted MFS family arabinose efflux permease